MLRVSFMRLHCATDIKFYCLLDLWSFTPLHEAASKSRVEVCSLLISEGADINFLNCHNKSPLDSAPRELQEKMTCELLLSESFTSALTTVLTIFR